MHRISRGGAGDRLLLLGNEAIARGAVEAGVQVVTAYPGTPSSEIVETLVEVTNGELLVGSSETMVNGLAVDTRVLEPGNAFVAFPGERVDGHSFLGEALAAGSRCLMITAQPADHA